MPLARLLNGKLSTKDQQKKSRNLGMYDMEPKLKLTYSGRIKKNIIQSRKIGKYTW